MTCEPTPIESAMADQSGQQQIWTAERQFDAMPRWLRWSGLAPVMGPTAWAIYQAVVMRDHQTMRLKQFRHYDGLACEITQNDLARTTGLSTRSVRRHCVGLLRDGYLTRYREGRSAVPSWFEINRDLLVQLFYYVGPILPARYGGLRDVVIHKVPEGGLVIYGEERYHPLIVEGAVLHTWRLRGQQANDRLPSWPRVDDLRAIVENFGEKHVARESTCEGSTWPESPRDVARESTCEGPPGQSGHVARGQSGHDNKETES